MVSYVQEWVEEVEVLILVAEVGYLELDWHTFLQERTSSGQPVFQTSNLLRERKDSVLNWDLSFVRPEVLHRARLPGLKK